MVSSPASTSTGTNVQVLLGDAVSVEFESITNGGDVSLVTSDITPTTPSGFIVGTSPTYYDISASAAYACPCRVTLPYDSANNPSPRIYHLEGGFWIDVTTSVDGSAHTITGVVSSLSFFVVGQGYSSGPPAVGGVVGLLASDPSSQQDRDSGARSGAALLGGAFAMVAAGTWYARRRWLR